MTLFRGGIFTTLITMASCNYCTIPLRVNPIIFGATQLGFEIRKSDDGARGGFALRSFQPGDVVAKVPVAAMIRFSAQGSTFPAEHAHELALNYVANRTFLGSYLPYLASLPSPGQVLSAETFPKTLIHEVQSPELETIILRERSIARAVYLGRFVDPQDPDHQLEPIPLALAQHGGMGKMPPHAFDHLVSVVSTRQLALADAEGVVKEKALVPVIDMLNTEAQKTNVHHVLEKGALVLRATTRIASGDELYLSYLPGLDHRPDMTLLHGYLGKVDSPILAATDLPTYDPAKPYSKTLPTDETYYGPGGKYNSLDEFNRLISLLANAPTSLEEDEALLSADAFDTWQQRLVVKFRVERKRALAWAIEAIRHELIAGGEGELKGLQTE
jgi:hypothetical protein